MKSISIKLILPTFAAGRALSPLFQLKWIYEDVLKRNMITNDFAEFDILFVPTEH